MRAIKLPILASGLWIGCVAGPTSAPTTPVSVRVSDTTEAQARHDAQARRITELEARLGLLEAEAREMRVLLRERESARPDVIRIGAQRSNPEAPETAEESALPVLAEQRPRERRPLLRSVGEPAPVPMGRPPVSLPMPPPGVADRLPVAPIPPVNRVNAVPAAEPSAVAPDHAAGESARIEYRAALTLLSNRDFDGALSALTEFLSKYPSHEMTDRAMFWRAEAFYAKRDYERALAEFEALGARFPRSEKAADALLKVGMCHQRLGDEQRAQASFRRVMEQFPESAAARTASKEGA